MHVATDGGHSVSSTSIVRGGRDLADILGNRLAARFAVRNSLPAGMWAKRIQNSLNRTCPVNTGRGTGVMAMRAVARSDKQSGLRYWCGRISWRLG